MKKAFGKVSHMKLQWKLESIGGLEGRIGEWMKDFLDGRKMKTVAVEKGDQRSATGFGVGPSNVFDA